MLTRPRRPQEFVMHRSLSLLPLALTVLASGFALGLLSHGVLPGGNPPESAVREVVIRPQFRDYVDMGAVRPLEQKPAAQGAPRRDFADALPPLAGPPPLDRAVVRRSRTCVEVISQAYEITRYYRSMKGPWSKEEVTLLDAAHPAELVWITAAQVEMMAADGQTPVSPQFMCHANLDVSAAQHNAALGMSKAIDERLFTLSQGQLAVKFPAGFGLPMRGDTPINLVTQALNMNHRGEPLHVRHKVRIDFVRQSDLRQPLSPLYECGVSGMKALDGESLVFDYLAQGGADTASGKLTSMCLPGLKANDWDEQADRLGRRFTGHWIVPPGRDENRTRVTTLLRLPWDTKAHYIAVHLHPFAESLELRDLTTGETVFRSQAENLSGGVGLVRVDHYASPAGLPLHKDHEYELVSRYHNTTQEDQDSMAVLYLYLHDREFRAPPAPQQPDSPGPRRTQG